jgi:hypothetical protein
MDFVSLYTTKNIVKDFEFTWDKKKVSKHTIEHAAKFSEFFSDLVIQDIRLVNYPSHILASAVIMASRLGVRMRELWSKDLEDSIGLKEQTISPCFDDLIAYYDRMFPDNSVTQPLKFW